MNSPLDAGSQSPSTASSESPPPEEVGTHPSQSATAHLLNFATQISSSIAGTSKRRLPTGPSFNAGHNNRDPKTRKRGDSGRMGSAGSIGWDPAKDGKREKEDLIDGNIVEFLRKEIGDPFNENAIKSVNRLE